MGFEFQLSSFGFQVWGLGFRVWSLGFEVWGFGFQVSGFGFSGFGFQVLGFGFRVLGFRLRVSGFGFQVSGYGVRVAGCGFRVSGFGFRFSGFRVSGFGFRVSGFGFRFSVFGFRVSNFGFRVSGCGLWVPESLGCLERSQPAPRSSGIRLVVGHFPKSCGPPEVNKEVTEEVPEALRGAPRALNTRQPCTVPSALRTGSNRPFQVLDLLWRPPESGGLWYKSRQWERVICSGTRGLVRRPWSSQPATAAAPAPLLLAGPAKGVPNECCKWHTSGVARTRANFMK